MKDLEPEAQAFLEEQLNKKIVVVKDANMFAMIYSLAISMRRIADKLDEVAEEPVQ